MYKTLIAAALTALIVLLVWQLSKTIRAGRALASFSLELLSE
jgi:hypothetical protein